MKQRVKFLLLLAILLAAGTFCRVHAQPSLSPPVWSNNLTHAQLTLTNCTNTTLQYVLQTSADLSNWTGIQTNFAVFTNQLVTIPTMNQQGFYRLLTNPAPIFPYAFVAKSNINFKGNNCVVDSFDSSNPLYSTGGLYDVTRRKANGSVNAGASIISTSNTLNANIYGRVMTGPGTTITNVGVGSQGAVGDINWNASGKGIESGYWSGGFSPTIPDVPAPPGWASLPAASNNIITLTSGGYLASSDPGKEIYINGPVTLWVTTSYSPNIVFNTNNPDANLALFVGATSGSSVSLSLGGNGALNYPGYARNFQIYGLPSLTSVSFNGNAPFIGTIYAPEATVSGGGGGNNTQDTTGAIVAKSISANGHWDFHYDESLATNGPTF